MKKYLENRSVVLGFLLALAVGSAVVSALSNSDGINGDWLSGLASNLGTEMVGALLTYWVFGVVIDNQNTKARLIREMRSRDNGIALHALEELGAHGWLRDGSLQKANLFQANLQGANLAGANLRRVLLGEANLQEANLAGANLRCVYLCKANLQQARLNDANLQQADLIGANLQQTVLREANLQGALLEIETNGEIYKAEFDENTILPDGSRWTPNTDMRRFTNPSHPNFWQPPWVKKS